MSSNYRITLTMDAASATRTASTFGSELRALDTQANKTREAVAAIGSKTALGMGSLGAAMAQLKTPAMHTAHFDAMRAATASAAAASRAYTDSLHQQDVAHRDVVRSIQQETALLRLSDTTRSIVSQQIAHENALRAQGVNVTARMSAEIRGELLAKQRQLAVNAQVASLLEREQRVLRSINGPLDEYKADVAALNALWARGNVSGAQYAATLERLKKDYVSAAGASKPGMMAGLGGMAGMAGAAGGLYAAKQVQELGDSYINLQNRLKTVTSATDTAAQMQDRLYGIAQKTRSEWTAVSEVFVRTSGALKGMGYSTEQVYQFTESLTKAVKMSGATSAEANNAMVQLSQGLASGTLRGDELRSVLEQLPTVADVIAKGLGVTRGQLRQMGADGKITAKDIIDSFAKARAEIDAGFGKLAPTLGEQWTVFKNLFIKMAGQLLTAIGPLIKALGSVVSVYDKVSNFEVGGAKPFQSIFGQIEDLPNEALLGDIHGMMLQMRIEGEKLGGAINESWIEIELLSYAAARWAKQQAQDEVKVKHGMDEFTRSIVLAKQGLIDMAVVQATHFAKMATGLNELRDRADPAGAAIRRLAKDAVFLRVAVQMGLLPIEEANKLLDMLAKQTDDKVAKSGKSAADAFKELMERIMGYRDSVDLVGATQRELAKVQADLTKAVKAHAIAEAEAIDIMERKTFAAREALDPLGAVTRGLQAEIDAIMGYTPAQKARNELMKIEADLYTKGIDLTEKQRRALLDLIQVKQQANAQDALGLGGEPNSLGGPNVAEALATRQKLIEESYKTTGFNAVMEYRDGMASLDAQLDANLITTREYHIAAMALHDTLAAVELPTEKLNEYQQGWKDGLEGIRDKVLDVSSSIESAFMSVFDSLNGVLHDFVMNTEIDFAALGRSIMSTLTNLIIQMLQAQLLMALMPGGGMPGLFMPRIPGGSGVGAVPAYANGSGGPMRVGGHGGTDSQLLAFRATPGELVTVNTPPQQRAQGGGQPNVNLKVVNQNSEDDIFGYFEDSPRFDKAVLNVMNRHKGKIKGMR